MKVQKFIQIDNETFYQTDWDNYSVSKSGKVLNNKTLRLLKQHKDRDGYWRVNLHDNNKSCIVAVHSIVVFTFLSKKKQGYVVDHINFDKNDNRLENLQYIPNWDNISRSHKNVCPRLKVKCDLRLRNKDYQFDSITKLLKFLNLKRYNIIDIRNGIKFIKKHSYTIVNFYEEKNYLFLEIV